MADPAQRERLLACLQPYMEVLALQATLQNRSDRADQADDRDVDFDTFVWIRVDCDNARRGMHVIDRAFLEGLELLALLAYADWGLWKQVTRTLWPERSPRWEDHYDQRPNKVGVHLRFSEATWNDTVYELLATTSQHNLCSTECQEARCVMMTLLSERGRTVEEIPMRIVRDNYGIKDDQLQKVVNMLQRHTQLYNETARKAELQSEDLKHRYDGLRVRITELLSGSDKPADVTQLELAAEILACGIPVEMLTWFLPVKVQNKFPHEYFGAMRRLFPTSGEEAHTVGVGSVLLGKNPNTVSFPVVLSAIASSDIVRTVRVLPDFRKTKEKPDLGAEQRLLWSWLAYSMFRKSQFGTSHRLRHVKLDMRTFNQESLEGFASILQSTNPVPLLFGRENPDVPEVVSASQIALLDPTSRIGGRLPRWTNEEPLVNLPVIERNDAWVSVLLPHWGQAWVHCDDILATEEAVSSGLRMQSIPRVSLLNVDIADTASFVALLRLIGKNIRCLGISASSSDSVMLDELFSSIFEVCPDLVELKVDCYGYLASGGRQANLQTFLDAFSSGTCRLERIQLDGVTFPDADSYLKVFVDALNDHRHPARHHLKELTINGLPVDVMGEATVDACLAMLANNFQLDRFALGFTRLMAADDRKYDQCYETFKDLDNQLVRYLEPAGKLGFLSVVSSAHDEGDQLQAVNSLDAQAISLIFEFAASSHRRRVIVAHDRMSSSWLTF